MDEAGATAATFEDSRVPVTASYKHTSWAMSRAPQHQPAPRLGGHGLPKLVAIQQLVNRGVLVYITGNGLDDSGETRD